MKTSALPRGLATSIRLAAFVATAGFAQPAPIPPSGSTPGASAAPAAPAPLKDADGRTLRRAPTGHVTNYYEEKVPPYTLPDPLVLKNGQPVRDAATWTKLRRPEILQLYATEIYGRVPERAPKVTWEVGALDPAALDGTAVRKEVVFHFGDTTGGPTVHLVLYTPAKAAAPAPVVLQLLFGNPPGVAPATPPVVPTPVPAAAPGAKPVAAAAAAVPRRGFNDAGPVADLIARGYGYASFRYSEVQADTAAGRAAGIIGLALAPNQAAPAPDEWGTISAWAWASSRVLDYLATEKTVDAKRVALVGHSRLGKTVLWAGAQDERFALIFSSQGGEMGSALARRDFGETIDDMAANFGYQFAGNFQKYSGHWNEMPVDAHFLISLCAPRPVLITGGSGDQWSDPRGEFLAVVAAGPVYRLLGQPDAGTIDMPPLDTPVATGKLAFLEHNGPHAITPLDWKVFLDYADKFLKPR